MNNVFLECKPDETLAIAVGVPGRKIIHNPGKGRVSRSLDRTSNVIGIVDEDPGSPQPSLLSTFVEKPECGAHDLKLLVRPDRNNQLIVICPRIEPWIIKTAKQSEVKMEDFNLGENVQELDEHINYRLKNLERLLQHLLEKKSPRLAHLKSLLAL